MANRLYADSNNPNWPSRTGEPSGGGRGNNPPSKKLGCDRAGAGNGPALAVRQQPLCGRTRGGTVCGPAVPSALLQESCMQVDALPILALVSGSCR